MDPAASTEIPLYSFDERAAWTGAYAHAPDMPLRIEAAAWKVRGGEERAPTRLRSSLVVAASPRVFFGPSGRGFYWCFPPCRSIGKALRIACRGCYEGVSRSKRAFVPI